jgi:predicted nucleic acid-binding protein
MTAVLDTNVLFARQNRSDQYHESASAILSGIDHGELPAIHIPDFVVAESMNLLSNKNGHRTAVAVLDRLIEGSQFDLQSTPESDFNGAQAIFRQHSHLSFVDSLIVAYMRRSGIQYLYSFDDDFDEIEGVTRLNAAVNPFE